MQINKEDILHTGNLELLAKKAVEGFITGYHKSPFHGFSVEFAEHRQYNSGESTKNIDWKLYGRTDKIYVKRYEEETNLRCQILIDVSSSMQIEEKDCLSKLQYSVWTTAVFLQMLKKQRDASGLCFFDSEVKEYTRIASSSRHYKELLFKLEPYLSYTSVNKSTGIATALHEIARQMHRRSLIVLFTDFFEEGRDLTQLFDAIKHLKHNKHEVIVFHTLHKPSEFDFDFPSAPMTFEDAETGEKLRLQPNEVKEQYVTSIKEYSKKLRLKMSQYKIDYVEADTSKGVEHALIPFLVKRKKVNS
ncbi:MAG: DUF58 domain-containing protein [Bacteroidia bacterium]|nr:DUF58 domain-containing protein [Bacteroidia bacterium]